MMGEQGPCQRKDGSRIEGRGGVDGQVQEPHDHGSTCLLATRGVGSSRSGLPRVDRNPDRRAPAKSVTGVVLALSPIVSAVEGPRYGSLRRLSPAHEPGHVQFSMKAMTRMPNPDSQAPIAAALESFWDRALAAFAAAVDEQRPRTRPWPPDPAPPSDDACVDPRGDEQ
jgi:hypothetical protein